MLFLLRFRLISDNIALRPKLISNYEHGQTFNHRDGSSTCHSWLRCLGVIQGDGIRKGIAGSSARPLFKCLADKSSTTMTNDILEQIAEDYFRSLGYFTQHNVKYRLDKGVHSDIDLLAIHPKLTGPARVAAVSCKSWQGGLDIATKIKILEKNVLVCTPRELKEKNLFREFSSKDWAAALTKKVLEVTGQQEFEFYTIVTLYHHGDKSTWENINLFRQHLPACKLKLIDLKEMIQTIWPNITTTPEHSELSRLLQLIKADNGRIVYQ